MAIETIEKIVANKWHENPNMIILYMGEVVRVKVSDEYTNTYEVIDRDGKIAGTYPGYRSFTVYRLHEPDSKKIESHLLKRLIEQSETIARANASFVDVTYHQGDEEANLKYRTISALMWHIAESLTDKGDLSIVEDLYAK